MYDCVSVGCDMTYIFTSRVCLQVGDNALNAMLRAALAKEAALWRSQFGMHIAFTRNDFNQCFAAFFCRVQVRLQHSRST